MDPLSDQKKLEALGQGLASRGFFMLGFIPDLQKSWRTHKHGRDDSAQNPSGRGHIGLLGTQGSAHWLAFERSPEYRNQEADALDAYSRRLMKNLCAPLALDFLGPSDGPPYPPFLSWAKRSGHFFTSPIGILMHSTFGLWTSFRGAVWFPDRFDRSALSAVWPRLFDQAQNGHEPNLSPCLTCSDRPCLEACPVQAFETQLSDQDDWVTQYDIDACAKEVRQSQTKIQSDEMPSNSKTKTLPARWACFFHGCAARCACPVAGDLRYPKGQNHFHMSKLLESRGL